MLSLISKFILFKIMKWKIVGEYPKDITKYVLIGLPHTSNYDFIIGLVIKFALKVPINFIGKKSLFKFPFGLFFRAVGGVPVDRSKNEKVVDAVTKIFKSKENFIFAVSPEGTRSKVSTWKTGFYYIAKQSNVPIVAMTFDFGKRQTEVFPTFYPTDNKEADFNYLKSLFIGIEGKVKENSFEA